LFLFCLLCLFLPLFSCFPLFLFSALFHSCSVCLSCLFLCLLSVLTCLSFYSACSCFVSS
jgi:hypothetical protein